MESKSMTARMCAFSRAFHSRYKGAKIFTDEVAGQIISKEEYEIIASNMSKGIQFFNPGFEGNDQEALRWIVDQQLSATPLARAAFAKKSLELAVRYGAKQYVILGAGFDTFAYRQPEWAKQLEIFEVDYPETSRDKRKRLDRAGIEIPSNVHFIEADFSNVNWTKELEKCEQYSKEMVSFCSLLGVVYYLSKENFIQYCKKISSVIPVNSTLVFDYPDEDYYTSQEKHAKLAKAANEQMQSSYSFRELESILEQSNFLIFEHLDSEEMTKQYFEEYNKDNSEHTMKAQEHVGYCLTVKK